MKDDVFTALAAGFASLEGMEVAATFLSSFLKIARPHLDRPGSTLLSEQTCASLLKENPKLHERLKIHHKNLDFAELEQDVPRIPIVSWESDKHLQPLSNFLDSQRKLGYMDAITRIDDTFDRWLAKNANNESIASHIEQLKLPVFNPRYPCILLHQLGQFCQKPTVQKCLENIFRTDTHTFIVNASGTGKTRLLLEGLCLHWGFYFTSVVDSSELGSHDTSYAIDDLGRISKFKTVLPMDSSVELAESNQRIAHRRFSAVLLARLIMFKLFLKRALLEGLTEEHKKKWLLFQLHPYQPGDVFTTICRHLAELKVADEVIENAIAQTLDEISSLGVCDMTNPANKLYIVLDEANRAAHSYPSAFHENGKDHPVLKEIIRAWAKHLCHLKGVSFVVAGTDIPRKPFEYPPEEWNSYTWVSDTGAFVTAADQADYVKTFLPPALVSSPEGELLLRRMWRWLRGRHRLTAAFIAILLQNDFRIPHCHLNELVFYATKYMPINEEGSSEFTEGVGVEAFNSYHQIDLRILNAATYRTLVHGVVLHAICHVDGRLLLGPRGHDLVSESQARYIDGQMELVSIDEPLIITAALKWFLDPDSRSLIDLEYFRNSIMSPEITPKHKLDYIALYLAMAFNRDFGTALAQIFTFPPKSPLWTKRSGHLISDCASAEEGDRNKLSYGKNDDRLVSTAEDVKAVLEWMRGDYGTPFCYCALETPLLMFTFETELHQRRIWFILQELPTSDDTIDAGAFIQDHPLDSLFTTDKDSFKEIADAFQKLPKPPYPSRPGTQNIMRVFASFGNKITVPSRSSASSTKTPYAVLNMDVFQSFTKSAAQELVFERFLASSATASSTSTRNTKRKRENSDGVEQERADAAKRTKRVMEMDSASDAMAGEDPREKRSESPANTPGSSRKKRKSPTSRVARGKSSRMTKIESAPSANTRSKTRT